MSVISVKDLCKSFSQGKEKINVLESINLQVEAGQVVALMGESGRGKSTLLQIISGIQDFDSGEIKILDKDINKLSDNKKTELRLNSLGFVYQYHHLLSDFTALENVMMPNLIMRKSKKQAQQKAEELLEKLGLKDRFEHKPAELSGGQQQRVAIARALANEPKIIFADEPSGNLDHKNADMVMDMFLKLSREQDTSLIIATHSENISAKTDRIFKL
jgi:lipoprotein-releasing system ATP-binding protein